MVSKSKNPLLRSVAGQLVDLLIPPACLICGQEVEQNHDARSGPVALCATCRRPLTAGSWEGCRRCGALAVQIASRGLGDSARAETCRGEPGDDGDSDGAGTDASTTDGSEPPAPLACGRCRGTGFYFDEVCALGPYQNELRRAVLLAKQRSQEPLARAMARLYAERRSNWLREAGADLVVPVPMHWARRFQRGVNSPELMARELARFLGVEVGLRALARRRRTAPQADLSPRQRFRNVRDAFRVRASYDIQGRSVLLVDDILTTGATSSEAARMLKEAGAARVVVAVLARAAGPEGR